MPPTRLDDAVDFDLHGIVRIRLLDAGPAEVRTVRRQLGPIDAPPAGDPDVTLRFVDRLALHGSLRLIGTDEAGFTDDAFIVLRGKNKTRARVQVPIADVGARAELICERGIAAVPLLIAIINLTALRKGYAAVHASAVQVGHTGVLIVGWAKGGKTELLLGLMARGGSYIGDEWVYLAPDAPRMFGIPEPMKLWAAHLDAMPAVRAHIGRIERARLRSLQAGMGIADAGSRVTPGGLRRLLRRSAHLAGSQAYVHVPPHDLFGRNRTVLEGSLDRLVFAVSTDSSDIALTEVASEEVARRMAASVAHERLDLVGHYLRFRFAFPEARNAVLEDADRRQEELLVAALRDLPAVQLAHPYPAPIPEMTARLEPWLQ